MEADAYNLLFGLGLFWFPFGCLSPIPFLCLFFSVFALFSLSTCFLLISEVKIFDPVFLFCNCIIFSSFESVYLLPFNSPSPPMFLYRHNLNLLNYPPYQFFLAFMTSTMPISVLLFVNFRLIHAFTLTFPSSSAFPSGPCSILKLSFLFILSLAGTPLFPSLFFPPPKKIKQFPLHLNKQRTI